MVTVVVSALDLQRLNSLRGVDLRKLSVESVLLPGQGTLPLHLKHLTVWDSKLSHRDREELFSYIRVSSTLQTLNLRKLYCSEHGDICSLPALDLQRHHSLKKLELWELSVESVLLPGQGTLPLPLTILIVWDSKLSHSGLKELFLWLRVSSTIHNLELGRLHCSNHGDNCCLPALDLQRNQSLKTVILGKFVEGVLLPGQLERQQDLSVLGEIPT